LTLALSTGSLDAWHDERAPENSTIVAIKVIVLRKLRKIIVIMEYP